MLVVQVVRILWTKATRGAPRSNERVGLPRAFPIVSDPGSCLVQWYQIAEWEAFTPQLVQCDAPSSPPGSIEALRITALPDGCFSLGIRGTPQGGQPSRHPIPQAITLHPGQYARLTVNARHTSYSGQHYSESVYNVACGDDIPSARFMDSPDQELDLKANLF